MLDIAFIRQNADVVRAAIKNKRVDLDLDQLLAADTERRETIGKIEKIRARKNEIAHLIPKATKEERPKLIEEGNTSDIFTNPKNKQTQDYITGRIG